MLRTLIIVLSVILTLYSSAVQARDIQLLGFHFQLSDKWHIDKIKGNDPIVIKFTDAEKDDLNPAVIFATQKSSSTCPYCPPILTIDVCSNKLHKNGNQDSNCLKNIESIESIKSWPKSEMEKCGTAKAIDHPEFQEIRCVRSSVIDSQPTYIGISYFKNPPDDVLTITYMAGEGDEKPDVFLDHVAQSIVLDEQ